MERIFSMLHPQSKVIVNDLSSSGAVDSLQSGTSAAASPPPRSHQGLCSHTTTRGLALKDTLSGGPVACLDPRDIEKWTYSIPSPDVSKESLSSLIDWTSHFDVPQINEDSFSTHSSMVDSTYASLSGTRCPQMSSMQPQRNGQQGFYVPPESGNSTPHLAFSPVIESGHWMQSFQSEPPGMILPPSSASISGELGNLAVSQNVMLPAQRPLQVPQLRSPQVMVRSDAAVSPIARMPTPGPEPMMGPQTYPHVFMKDELVFSNPVQYQSVNAVSSDASATVMYGQQHQGDPSTASPVMMRQLSNTLSSHLTGSSLSPTSPALSMDRKVVTFKTSPDDVDDWVNYEGYAPDCAVQSVDGWLIRPDRLNSAGPGELVTAFQDSFGQNLDMDEDVDAPHGIITRAEENARSDPLYKAQPDANKLYSCPYANDENCGHKTTNLKCVYDKWIDSHLRPFRCKEPDCMEIRFSSTACLLRHRREAHGMYGHGQKPFLCEYVDCDRSRDGYGFPRKWNKQDHMRRVHGHVGPINDQPAAATRRVIAISRSRSAAAGSAQAASRSRRVEKRTRPTRAELEAQAAAKRARFIQGLHEQWLEKRSGLCQRLEAMHDPNDLAALAQVKEDLEAMEALTSEMNATA